MQAVEPSKRVLRRSSVKPSIGKSFHLSDGLARLWQGNVAMQRLDFAHSLTHIMAGFELQRRVARPIVSDVGPNAPDLMLTKIPRRSNYPTRPNSIDGASCG